MEIYDVIMLLVLAATALLGWRKGLATQVASILSIVVSYMVAVNFREPIAARIDASPPWNTFAAMLLLYLGTSLVIWLLFRQIRQSIDRLKLREFDRQMGLLFGAAKGGILCCVITLFAVTLLSESQRQVIIESKSGYVIASLLNSAETIMPREIQQVLAPYIRQLDDRPGGGLDEPLRLDQPYAGGDFPGAGFEPAWPSAGGVSSSVYLPPDGQIGDRSGPPSPDGRRF